MFARSPGLFFGFLRSMGALGLAQDLLGLLRQSLAMAVVKQEGEPLPKKLKVGLGNRV